LEDNSEGEFDGESDIDFERESDDLGIRDDEADAENSPMDVE